MTRVVSIPRICLYHVARTTKSRRSAKRPIALLSFSSYDPPILLATTFISYHALPRLSLAALTLQTLQSRRPSRPRTSAHRHRRECVRPSTSPFVCCPHRRRRLHSFHEPQTGYTTLPPRGARGWRKTSAPSSATS